MADPTVPDRAARWRRTGSRVWVAPLATTDIEPLVAATRRSAGAIGEWNPVDPDAVRMLPRMQGDQLRTFVIHTRDPGGGDGVAARANLSGLIRGRLNSATLGYDAFAPYAGSGLTREGLALVLDIAFAGDPAGLALHRVEAGVNPGNIRSAILLRGLGFRYEGRSERLLWLPGGPQACPDSGPPSVDWRDHDRYALLADRPARPWTPGATPASVVIVSGAVGMTDEQVERSADRLARDLGMPMLLTGDLAADALTAVVRRCHGGVVIAIRSEDLPTFPSEAAERVIELTLPEALDDVGVARLATTVRARLR